MQDHARFERRVVIAVQPFLDLRLVRPWFLHDDHESRFGVVCKDFDHPAVGDPAAPALSHHAFKFGLEHRQAGDSRLYFPQVRPRDLISLFA